LHHPLPPQVVRCICGDGMLAALTLLSMTNKCGVVFFVKEFAHRQLGAVFVYAFVSLPSSQIV
jgi:hypothetical protein